MQQQADEPTTTLVVECSPPPSLRRVGNNSSVPPFQPQVGGPGLNNIMDATIDDTTSNANEDDLDALLSPLHNTAEGHQRHEYGVKSLSNSHNLGLGCPLVIKSDATTQRSSPCSGLKSLYGLIEEADAADNTMVTLNSQNGSATMLSTSYVKDFRAQSQNGVSSATTSSVPLLPTFTYNTLQSPTLIPAELAEFDTLSGGSIDDEDWVE